MESENQADTPDRRLIIELDSKNAKPAIVKALRQRLQSMQFAVVIDVNGHKVPLWCTAMENITDDLVESIVTDGITIGGIEFAKQGGQVKQ